MTDGLYPWLKGLHVAFMVTWFAGLFYLPRLFIYHAEAADAPSRERFRVMERRLYAIMSIGAALTALFGIAMLWQNPALLRAGWFQVKLLLLAGLIAYHVSCRLWMTRLAARAEPQPTRGLRWYNEIPALFLLAIVLLAIVKPA